MNRSHPPSKLSKQKRNLETKPKLANSNPVVDEGETVTGRRKRKQVVFYGNVTSTAKALKSEPMTERAGPSSVRSTRTSTRSMVGTPSKPGPAPPLPRGTRVSRRLHAVDDEWQQVPEEWLSANQQAESEPADDESELSDLSEEELATVAKQDEQTPTAGTDADSSDSALSEAPSAAESIETADGGLEGNVDASDEEAAEQTNGEEHEDEFELGVKEAANLPEGFIEWEAFAKSKHPDEKAFHKLLSTEIAPQIVEVLEEQERLKQEAINNRKRSSRIAMRELEREELQKQEQAQREMEERMERLRQEEARKEREEQEALAKERAREERLREREERLAARERAIHERAESEARQREQAERAREKRKRRREGEEVSDDEGTAPTSRAATSAPSESQGSWELKCEVCKLHGWNLSDETDVVCCDDCGRWQHMPCHDRQDRAAGRKPRDWDSVDFRCQECELRATATKRPKTEESDIKPMQQKVTISMNGNAANVEPTVDVTHTGNSSLHRDVPPLQSHQFANGYQAVHRDHIPEGHLQHQTIARHHAPPPPPHPHLHVPPQGHQFAPSPSYAPSYAAPSYANPSGQHTHSGHRPFQSVQAHVALAHDYHRQQHYHPGPVAHRVGQPSYANIHHPAPSHLVHQRHGTYASNSSTLSSQYPAEEHTHLRPSGLDGQSFSVPSAER
ncbi:hypothetical protein A1Q2_06427 [Trichosporon asahii var. asahii CBS 8904]|uniref:Zinc finger PHD-type domain-containing protein n=1 Tax=Trichosporon asahii var. asahii (strain CBS 8904) TaxID=1220162 RepID=K1VR88_TRIAC|nr:hypothetical protein A1Q2_06427 [Trichosporon asahii var. asahii CBS 8904]